MTIHIETAPHECPDLKEFQDFVRSELGDVAVYDENRFISPKIRYYWAAWRVASDVHNLDPLVRWNSMLVARAYWRRYLQVGFAQTKN